MYAPDDIIMFRNQPCRVKHIYEGRYYLIPAFATDESLYFQVPVEDIGHHLRQPMSREQAMDLLEAVEGVETVDYTFRSIEYVLGQLLVSDNPQNWVKVLKSICLSMERQVARKRKITEKDKMYFTKAETMLYSELAIALQLSREQTKALVHDRMRDGEQ